MKAILPVPREYRSPGWNSPHHAKALITPQEPFFILYDILV